MENGNRHPYHWLSWVFLFGSVSDSQCPPIPPSQEFRPLAPPGVGHTKLHQSELPHVKKLNLAYLGIRFLGMLLHEFTLEQFRKRWEGLSIIRQAVTPHAQEWGALLGLELFLPWYQTFTAQPTGRRSLPL